MKSEKKKAPTKTRRAYAKPDFESSLAFERQALACTGMLNQGAAPPAFCSLKS